MLYLWWFVLECMHEQARAANEVAQGMRMGGSDAHRGARFWVEMVGLWTGTDFLITAPVLFAFVARGSLVNSFLGLSYGVSIKWHKCVHLNCQSASEVSSLEAANCPCTCSILDLQLFGRRPQTCTAVAAEISASFLS